MKHVMLVEDEIELAQLWCETIWKLLVLRSVCFMMGRKHITVLPSVNRV